MLCSWGAKSHQLCGVPRLYKAPWSISIRLHLEYRLAGTGMIPARQCHDRPQFKYAFRSWEDMHLLKFSSCGCCLQLDREAAERRRAKEAKLKQPEPPSGGLGLSRRFDLNRWQLHFCYRFAAFFHLLISKFHKLNQHLSPALLRWYNSLEIIKRQNDINICSQNWKWLVL